ncbi:hypothetical protein [Campylobacter armoricus]|uniref:Uncharacterized protein n=1 Tax=Campylobacter armoricus TaxID=2505970 RepID=A0A7L5HJI0_9BACT|nr:hypothetical protein [Campylobacter armoricus]QKF79528.1 hypothetical protein CARM_0610 [Campylobacter armoricus]
MIIKILNFLTIKTHYFCAYEAISNDGEKIKGSTIATEKRYFWKTSNPDILYRYIVNYLKEDVRAEKIVFTQFHKL